MNRLIKVTLAAASAAFVIGCGGGSGIDLKAGDMLEITQHLERERFEATYGSNGEVSHANGYFAELPAGTVMRVFVTPRKDAVVFEAVPVKAEIKVTETAEDGTVTEVTKVSEDENELLAHFVQERFRTHDFMFYAFHLKPEQLGTVIKKLN